MDKMEKLEELQEEIRSSCVCNGGGLTAHGVAMMYAIEKVETLIRAGHIEEAREWVDPLRWETSEERSLYDIVWG